ncbi:patatin-like phospholipase family protein [Olleya aquimaris]|uniref:NTE family protein n=1 Tax=Olleya aquimaris TaxID=639310 RepID=A0A327RCW9_9FLAO|nr:patatin-like phospholipase family protein [Olleya aquimaris]RAJ13424.1 NTE family protein [Olleya aquimaris]
MYIKNLALKGGGVKGIAYVGALKELDKAGIYKGLERVSGTSAGAIVALMIALQLSPTTIEDLMRKLNFKAFKSGWNPLRIFTKYGLYSGDEILKFIYKCYEASSKGLTKEATFEDFHNAGCKDIIVFASDLNTHNICEFSYYKTPKCIVAEAIRASMSIPLFFKGWQFSNGIPNNHIYVDGGVMFNYPLSFFDKPRFHNNQIEYHQESLGLFLEPKKIYERNENLEDANLATEKKHGIKKLIYRVEFKYGMWIFLYIKHLFETLLNSQDVDLFEESHLVDRTIFIDDLGISATNFNLSDQEKTNLVNSGRAGAIRYFEFKKAQQANQQPT